MSNIPEDCVRMEQKLCAACGQNYDSGAFLLHRQLRSIKNAFTGWGTCPACQKRIDDGFVILVEAIAPRGVSRMQLDQASRTGRVVFLRKETTAWVFNVPAPDPIMFIEPGVIEKLEAMYREHTGEEAPHA